MAIDKKKLHKVYKGYTMPDKNCKILKKIWMGVSHPDIRESNRSGKNEEKSDYAKREKTR